MLLNAPLVVLHRRCGPILFGVPTAGVVAERFAAGGWVTPTSVAQLGLGVVGRLLRVTSRAEPDCRAGLVYDGAVLPCRDLVSTAPVVAAFLSVSHSDPPIR